MSVIHTVYLQRAYQLMKGSSQAQRFEVRREKMKPRIKSQKAIISFSAKRRCNLAENVGT